MKRYNKRENYVARNKEHVRMLRGNEVMGRIGNGMRVTTMLLVVVLLSSALGIEMVFANPSISPAQGENWLDGWNYRKSHSISGAPNATSGYQIEIKVYYGSGTDHDNSVYLDSKCQSDFGDIRFTDNDGSTLLDYWMEDGSIGNYGTIFWVVVADDLNTECLIYLYYGTTDVTPTTSNITATFLLADDFSTAPDMINNYNTHPDPHIGTGTNTTTDGIYHLVNDSSTIGVGLGYRRGLNLSDYNGLAYEFRIRDNGSDVYQVAIIGDTVHQMQTQNGAGWSGGSGKYHTVLGGSGSNAMNYDYSITGYSRLKVGVDYKGYGYFFVNGTHQWNNTDAVPEYTIGDDFYLGPQFITGGEIWLDFWFARHWLLTEPSHSGWGYEEGSATSTTTTVTTTDMTTTSTTTTITTSDGIASPENSNQTLLMVFVIGTALEIVVLIALVIYIKRARYQ